MSPYYADDQIELWHGDAIETLRQLAADSVDCCVTSPPYFGLRDYAIEGQYGLEKSPSEYVEIMRQVFAEVRRVMVGDGTLWLNLGDSYSTSGQQGGGKHATIGNVVQQRRTVAGIGPKNLLGIPWQVAFALQGDGWTLRNAIVWHKPNAMPESVRDRLSSDYEFVFLFAKSRKYYFDLDAIREPLAFPEAADGTRVFGGKHGGAGKVGSAFRIGGGMPNVYGKGGTEQDTPPGGKPQSNRGPGRHSQAHVAGRNPGAVWTMPTRPFPAAHFATYPEPLARRCIMAGCRPGGVVLDPFSGSGTTGMAATRVGRRYVGIDLSAEYLDLSLTTRLQQSAIFDVADECAADAVEMLPLWEG